MLSSSSMIGAFSHVVVKLQPVLHAGSQILASGMLHDLLVLQASILLPDHSRPGKQMHCQSLSRQLQSCSPLWWLCQSSAAPCRAGGCKGNSSQQQTRTALCLGSPPQACMRSMIRCSTMYGQILQRSIKQMQATVIFVETPYTTVEAGKYHL